ncbi:hypothetical protein BIZ83_gp093 [Erwinia phage vB_EamM_ChrisDB]|uniref:hypothetical protein n=1 Tax=Erwinia phage vB_EamM_ChrisDB TaxID=1883371 RepID=UPI00081CEF9C|nr:hypothetical protein BIZ83_gp093 [Erwinia phage vB_EamM_ChrisDB]ANZ48760.1 hypothetical protein CHRISDB_198 [Erwinia phage vB_EamM_ChrisDB]
MLIYQMTAEQIINAYGKKMPNVITALEKTPVEQYAVFEEDGIPKAVFAVLHQAIPMMGKGLHLLTAIATVMFDLNPKLMQRYRTQYGKKGDVIAYDLPSHVHIEEMDASVVRYSPTEEAEGHSVIAYHGIELDDSDLNITERDLTDMVNQAPGVRFSLGYTNQAKQHSMGRYLAEVHGYTITRRVYIL